MLFGNHQSELFCEENGFAAPIREIASVIDVEQQKAISKCKNNDLPREVTKKIRPQAFECIKNRASEANGLFTAEDVEKLNNELDGKLESIIECSDSAETFASQVLPNKIFVNEQAVLEAPKENLLDSLAHEVTHLLVRNSCLSQQKSSCEAAYNEAAVQATSQNVVVTCFNSESKNATRLIIAAAPDLIAQSIKREEIKARRELPPIVIHEQDVQQGAGVLGTELMSYFNSSGRIRPMLSGLADRVLASADRYLKAIQVRVTESTVAKAKAPSTGQTAPLSLPLASRAITSTSTAIGSADSAGDPREDEAEEANRVITSPELRASKSSSSPQGVSRATSSVGSAQRQNARSSNSGVRASAQKGASGSGGVLADDFKIEKMAPDEVLKEKANPSFLKYLLNMKYTIYLNSKEMIGAPPAGAASCFQLDNSRLRKMRCK